VPVDIGSGIEKKRSAPRDHARLKAACALAGSRRHGRADRRALHLFFFFCWGPQLRQDVNFALVRVASRAKTRIACEKSVEGILRRVRSKFSRDRG